MAWNVKLKEGFFRTVDCELTLKGDVLTLIPRQKKRHPSLKLKFQDIDNVSLNRKNQPYPELEVRTLDRVLVAQLTDTANEEMLILEFNAAFQSRFVVL
ncbi:hypothetical protein [Acidaminobacter hydrogenoformans]|uniref:Uncharacterized protein n=1 Tax=Acidaminobacter hydrogenoformans DSM 2784 TaxID=1120920 RepID=A0A1G5RTE0_9FIRM|nr:hypothetical protein [Acidaminobacter hydrogenoformans]SCZ77354.1 hypothetical protein SAMN03080599_00739 [Acidaminobacter hydrogenoformans DSM 2784]